MPNIMPNLSLPQKNLNIFKVLKLIMNNETDNKNRTNPKPKCLGI